MRALLVALVLLGLVCPCLAAERPVYATWVMIWNGSTEKGWWKESDYNGCKVRVGGRWQSINWNDKSHIRTYFDGIRAAGISVIIVDFTNGFRWGWQAQYLQELCAEHRMQLAIAYNPQAGKALEDGARHVWEKYAGPQAAQAKAYLQRDGKPLLVLYTWRKGYEACQQQAGEFTRKFTTVWASGEDSDKDKWGWQVEPHVGPVASGGAMFVTGSLKFGGVKADEDRWRRHLAWLDYGFLVARRAGPAVCVVGSYDDVHERNAWMVADTSAAKRGWQGRDITGALSTDAYYRRVCDWILRGKPSVIAGGAIPDGTYRVKAADGRVLGLKDNASVLAPAVLATDGDQLENFIWFYHLGNQEYRIVKLNAGLSLEDAGGSVRSNWDDNVPAQRWVARRSGAGFALVNKATGKALDVQDGNVTTRPPDPAAPSQTWQLVDVALLPR